ncbi:hypothetical protein ZHAS_00006717 [Anopheles sinensis]|uniref:Uncharacterized protein n=1 Tax=Anopheles sinensis TaxID=74873 RepID=A0A084VM15_ANOSI|nr:hypothetical protein ZHAS_00006717 [Anopheles sinensis]
MGKIGAGGITNGTHIPEVCRQKTMDFVDGSRGDFGVGWVGSDKRVPKEKDTQRVEKSRQRNEPNEMERQNPRRRKWQSGKMAVRSLLGLQRLACKRLGDRRTLFQDYYLPLTLLPNARHPQD